jgi:AcrR family transcriptional regulator
MTDKQKASRLSRVDWERAAIQAIADGGPPAVAVEPLARDLNVSKGSFYWHFSGRDELVRAALERWESLVVTERIAKLDEIPDAGDRLKALLDSTVSPEEIRRGWKVTVALSTYANDPLVEPVLQRVTRARLTYLEDCYEALGHTHKEARQRATLTYAIMLGLVQLANDAPAHLVDERLEGAYQLVLRTFLPESEEST